MTENRQQTTDLAWPIDGLESVKHCSACGFHQTKVLYEGLTDKVFYCAPGQWVLQQCTRCGCAFLNPRPTIDTLHLAYKSYYTHDISKRIQIKDLGVLRRFTRALANGYRNQRYGGKLKPSSLLGPILIRLLPSQRKKLDRELRYLPRFSTGVCLLDVGFGNGDFLNSASAIGWAVSGADPDPVAVGNAKARGLLVREGGIEAFADMPEYFDVITLNHVIEHVHDPKDVLEQAYKLLKPGGWLYISTPNIDSIGHEKFGRDWRGLEIPRHLVIFNWAALEVLIADCGYALKKRYLRTEVYPGLALASRSIRDGVAPYNAQKRPKALDYVAGFMAGLRCRLDHRHTEFITLIAKKTQCYK